MKREKGFVTFVRDADGYVEHRLDGRPHCEHGPAITSPGRIEYWRFGKIHRKDGPAVIVEGYYSEWYFNGKLHRTDGPAMAHVDGNNPGKYIQYWYVHGRQIETPEEFRKVLGLTKDQILFIMLQWGWYK